jgi:hypothetical protein
MLNHGALHGNVCLFLPPRLIAGLCEAGSYRASEVGFYFLHAFAIHLQRCWWERNVGEPMDKRKCQVMERKGMLMRSSGTTCFLAKDVSNKQHWFVVL